MSHLSLDLSGWITKFGADDVTLGSEIRIPPEEHLLLAAVFVKTDVRSIASEQSASLSRAKSIYLAFN